MSRLSGPAFTECNGLADLDNLIDNISLRKVVILDCHEEWCGPTTQAMQSFYAQIYSEYEEPENRIYLATCAYSEAISAKLQTMCNDHKLKNQGCRPLFLIFRNAQCVGVVDGLSTPAIASNIKLFIPPIVRDDEEK